MGNDTDQTTDATWNGNKLRLTVAHCLKLRGTPSDVPGNPVQVLLDLRDPGVLMPLAAELTGKPEGELAEDLDGAGFHELQQAVAQAILDFFLPDPSFHEFLQKVRKMDQETRRESEEKGLVELRKELRTAWGTDETEPTGTDPTGGESSTSPPDSPDSTPAPTPSGTSTSRPAPGEESPERPPRKSSVPSIIPAPTGNAT